MRASRLEAVLDVQLPEQISDYAGLDQMLTTSRCPPPPLHFQWDSRTCTARSIINYRSGYLPLCGVWRRLLRMKLNTL
jgi:hypothetical protein